MRLTVVVPTYNAAKFIEKFYKSVIQQCNFSSSVKVLFVDDGSTDDTAVKIQNFVKRYPNNIFYYRKSNGNWGSVINFVRENKLITTEYVTICDADDWYCKKGFKKIWKYLNGKNELVIANFFKKRKFICIPILVYQTLRTNIFDHFLKQTPYYIPLGKFIRTDVFYKLSPLRENMFYQDSVLIARLINQVKKVAYCKSYIGVYFYSNPLNSMSRPWNNERYYAEVSVVQGLIQNEHQEVASIHLLRPKFRRMLKTNDMKFVVNRKFKFKFVSIWFRWLYILVFFFCIKKYFKSEKRSNDC